MRGYGGTDRLVRSLLEVIDCSADGTADVAQFAQREQVRASVSSINGWVGADRSMLTPQSRRETQTFQHRR